MPPKGNSKVARLRAANAASAASASSSQASATSSSTATATPAGPVPSTSSAHHHPDDSSAETGLPPAKALPSEPMDLDETQETGEGDTEMVDYAPAGPLVGDDDGVKVSARVEAETASRAAKGKGKAKVQERGEMASMQDVGKDARHLVDGLEALGQDMYKGKSLSDPIKSVTVRSQSLLLGY